MEREREREREKKNSRERERKILYNLGGGKKIAAGNKQF